MTWRMLRRARALPVLRFLLDAYFFLPRWRGLSIAPQRGDLIRSLPHFSGAVSHRASRICLWKLYLHMAMRFSSGSGAALACRSWKPRAMFHNMGS
ncbi:hypothetical protein KCP71_16715 [Salmonella enterica subsp. enterica]|nr:hypothetical protein KCP71_16715 [Salmonella enterica subsp. enterica]